MRQYVFGDFRDDDLSEEAVKAVLAAALGKREEIQGVPLADILALLDRLSRRWADPADAFRLRALELLPDQLGWSRQMVERDLAGFAMALSRPFCEAKIAAELGDPACLDGWIRQARAKSQQGPLAPLVRAMARGVVLHVAAGNVGSVGALSVVEGLLGKNVNLLKAASSAPLFALLFAESLRETDEIGRISACVAVLQWSGRRARHHVLFKEHADAIVVWGGEDAVKEYRDGLGLQATLIEWGPKVSVGLVAREADLANSARAAAIDVSLWDQNACSSAQVIYVEGSDRVAPFVDALKSELSAFAVEYPPGLRSMQERAEITKARESAKVDVAIGRAELHVPGSQDWTIVVEADPTFKLSPLFRTVYIKPVADLADCAGHLAPYRAYLQTVGLAAPADRILELADGLAAVGAIRVTELGGMGGGYAGEPHDGSMALQRLIKWVSLDLPDLALRRDPVEYLAMNGVLARDFARLREAYRRVRELSPFYREHLPDVSPTNLSDWAGLPTLTKDRYREHVPPEGRDLLCGDATPLLTLRSGGTSGRPLVASIAERDFEADMEAGARGAWAAGLRPGDRVANMLFAGNLYGSFISVQSIAERIGCQTFPLTSSAPLVDILEVLQTFEIDTLLGLPSHLQTVFAAMQQEPEKFAVKKVLYTGEAFYVPERERIQTALRIERIASLGYGTVDAGPIAYQCEHCQGSVHHVLSGHVWVDIVDRETFAPVEPGAIGEILVTNLHPRLMPLIRYRVGDLGRMVTGTCPCGRRSP
ncbi:MAG: aldehyde dehydrogenase family protein, partial [Cyanobacteria bacterium REEB65]|nr:aldehyde dehydrogenase family protein [Cyanobacteria bacterium REEB65]